MSNDITAWQLNDGFVVPQYADGGYAEGNFDVLQRVLCVMLTETDSPRYTFGRTVPRTCPFMSGWRRGDISNEADVYRYFSLCQCYIRAAMEDQSHPDDPPDQKFKSLQLRRIRIDPGVVSLELVLETQGGSLQFNMPIPT